MERNEKKFELDILCKNLQSAEKSTRQNALKQLLELSAKAQSPDEYDLEKILDSTYLHLIKCYSDRYETCRCLAASIVTNFVSNIDKANDFYLNYIIPILRRRIGQTEIIEESEELRLQLLEQVGAIIVKFQSNDEDRLMPVYNDIIDIVLKTLTDPYANVQRQCCEVIKKLAVATSSFYLKAELLVDPLIQLLSHRQSATRVLAVETLGVVCLYITNKNSKIVTSIMSISPLLMDSVPFVRLECGRVGCRWLLKLNDRYSFFERILPLVLCCLKDDTPEIRNEIEKSFIVCGNKYYEENENELQKIALIDSDFPCCDYKTTVAEHRPTLGCRALVQRSLRVVSIVFVELQDWKESVRLHSLKLLWQIVLHAEGAFTCKFLELFPLLAKCCQDKDASVVAEAKRVATLTGRLLNFDDWIQYGTSALEAHPTSLGVLRCFSSLFAGADNVQSIKSVEEIAKIISSSAICHNLNDTYQNTALDVVEQLVSLHLDTLNTLDDKNEARNNVQAQERYLFESLIKIMALSNAHDSKSIEIRGTTILDKLSTSPQNRINLQGKYMTNIIDTIEDLDCEHSELSERIIMLYGCIKLCGFQIEYLDAMKAAIKLVLQNSTAKAQIKILSAVSIAILNSNTEERQVRVEHLSTFIGEILQPCLIWRAGRNVESIRAMATQTLCAIGEAFPVEANELFPKLAKHFVSLSEDNLAITRAYAFRCLLKSGNVLYEDYRQLTTNILNGFDDPCADVRELGIECISHIKVDRSDPTFSESSYLSIIEYILSRLILHLDDPYIKLRPKLLNSITTIAKLHPTIFKNEIDKLPCSYAYNDDIERIKSLSLNS